MAMKTTLALMCLVGMATSHTISQEQPMAAVTSCSREGLLCKDCLTLVYCKRLDTAFQEIPLSVCTNLAPCDAMNNSCVYGGTCRFKTFKCPHHVTGRYPDPYSCLQYHDCSNGADTLRTCTFPNAYDVNTEGCSNTVDDKYCTNGPVNVCVNNGDVFPIPGHSYQFECLKDVGDYYDTIYPQLEVTAN